jgi:coenzyme PQQ precursor peptide PqqA
MQWTKPDFEEISLNMEVTAYVNTDDEAGQSAGPNRHGPDRHSPDRPGEAHD